jgi:hypothetical protein
MRINDSPLAAAESGLELREGQALTGVLDGLDPDGRVYFRADGQQTSRPVTLGLSADDGEVVRAALNQSRALVLQTSGDDAEWVLVGILRDRVTQPSSDNTKEPIEDQALRPESAIVDGKTVHFEASEEIVLRCGKGSITLRKDGKIVIKGTHLLSRAAGVNRIKGGQVNIN